MNVAFDAAGEPSGNGACHIDDPVRLRAVETIGEGSVAFPDHPLVACHFAEVFAAWTRDLAAPLVKGSTSQELSAIRTGPGAECRTRDHIPGAKMSAHATGTALDIARFDLAGGSQVDIPARDAAGAQLLAAMRSSACGWFTTILGPGTDPFHATHLHFDVMQHGSSPNYRICE